MTDPNNAADSSAALVPSMGIEEDDDFFYDYAKAAQNRQEAWTEENWESEMEKHPLFISKNPEPGQESPLVEALSKLKYDPDFNSPLELMESYKSDGNENFRIKKYRWAVDNYTEGVRIARKELSKPDASVQLEQKAKVIKMVATLYNNRASSHFYLGNYRSSAKDAKLAYSLDPTHQKAILRVPRCLEALHKYAQVIEYCEAQLSENSRTRPDAKTKEELGEILKSATERLKKQQRDQRKVQLAEDKREAAHKQIEAAVRARNIAFRGSLFETNHGAAVHGHLVHFDEADLATPLPERSLIWPVVFMYHESGQTDFIQAFHEGTTFKDLLAEMFASPPEWDTKGVYRADKLRIWYHSYEDERYSGLILKEIDQKLILYEALTQKGYIVTNALPTFIVGLEEPKY